MKVLVEFVRKLGIMFYTFVAKLSNGNFKSGIKVNGYSRFTKNTFFGFNTHFNGMRVYGKGKVTFGDNFHSGKNCKIITDIHNYNGSKIPYDETSIIKNVTIENNVWLGMDVTILGGVTIGEGAIIQAGSVVVKDIEKLKIAGGHPAIPFSNRNAEHYNSLVKAKAFF